jgi:hypothetical protein
MEIANKLYNRANGYDYVEQQAIKLKDGQFEERVEVVDIVKHAIPDTTSIIFWLKNRQSAKWKDKTATELSGGVNVTNLTDFK